jgi:3-deoxy-D-manno-octulosonic-acid transferase
VLTVYSLLWAVLPPFLLLSRRLRPSLSKRLWFRPRPGRADIWIQAASTGEAGLAAEILGSWPASRPLQALLTTNTLQGLEVLANQSFPPQVEAQTALCPRDSLLAMRAWLRACRPRAVVFLETELWPGLMRACQLERTPLVVLNGRLSSRSLARYLFLERLWSDLAPNKILAVTQKDAARFERLFPSAGIGTMPNIKFDRARSNEPIPFVHNPLSGLLKAQSQFVVFGSVRRQEESLVAPVIQSLARDNPKAIIGLFPRHLNRLEAWKEWLSKQELTWELRSRLTTQVHQGTIILWDRFGELEQAYALARGAFVGGTLTPLGGQNFLEPLNQGVIPCIGPFWPSFAWAGHDLQAQDLVKVVRTPDELTAVLQADLSHTPQRDKVHQRFQDFVQARSGGTELAIREMIRLL